MPDDELVEEKLTIPQESWSSSGVFRLKDEVPVVRNLHTSASKLPNEKLAWWRMTLADTGNPSFKGVILWPTVLDPDGDIARKVHESVTSLLSSLPSEPIQKYMEALHKITDLS